MKLQNIHHDITFLFDKIKNVRIADEFQTLISHTILRPIFELFTP